MIKTDKSNSTASFVRKILGLGYKSALSLEHNGKRQHKTMKLNWFTKNEINK